MKKLLMMMGLVALTGAALILTGCCGSGSCPFGKGGNTPEICGCGSPKGSTDCVVACNKAKRLCKCGAIKGSPECAEACKK